MRHPRVWDLGAVAMLFLPPTPPYPEGTLSRSLLSPSTGQSGHRQEEEWGEADNPDSSCRVDTRAPPDPRRHL